MVSPYDLSVPGGVQGQVLGLSAALRDLGHEVRGGGPGPTRGQRGRSNGIRVGRSVGVRANGSVAPGVDLAGGGVPGRPDRARPGHRRGAPARAAGAGPQLRVPGRGTPADRRHLPPQRAERAATGLFGPLAPLGRSAAWRCGARSPSRPGTTSRRRSAASTRCSSTAIDVDALRRPTRRLRPTGPTVLFVGRHEPRKGLAVLLEACDVGGRRRPMLWVAGEGPDTAELRAPVPAVGRPRSGWERSPTSEKAARMAGADVFCAPVARRRVVRDGAARGHGGRLRRRRLGHRRLPRRRRAATRWLVPPGDPAALAVGARRGAGRRGGRARPVRRTRRSTSARRHAEQWSMAKLAGRYVEIYERVLAEPRGTRPPRAQG